MFFQHIYDKSLAQASYLIGCQAERKAVVIDAKRDIDTYLRIAQENNLTITHITETHIHADFLSGSRELAAVTGAQLYLSDEGGEDWQYEFPHIGLKDGDTLSVGNLSLKVIHTPGHTPESISFLLTDHPATDEPVMIFTGDFVFVGDVGRPDLLEKAAGIIGTQEQGAKEMYHSVRDFSQLPEFIQVWPGHGAGSACGKSLGAVPSSTVGYEKIRNWAFQYGEDEEGFINDLLEGQPEPPKYFAMMKKLNKVERPLLTEVPEHTKLSGEAFLRAYNNGVKVIDTRNKADFAKGFLPGSINIQGNNSFATWMGWIMEYSEPFILVAEDGQIDDLTRKLMRIGMDQMTGYIDHINDLGIDLEIADVIDTAEFKAFLNRDEVQVLDVRNRTEYETAHIENAVNVFVGTLQDHIDTLSREKQIVIHCQSGYRAAIAYSLLRKNGFDRVKNYSGGMKEWLENGGPVKI
ncbi:MULTISPECIES: MBL fold metallo-hydrolase [Chryseobacterium]|uniref:Hydroxyacylglutathione hydrolase n=1 Tax=Chryseobacterium camelliae TaxID=1265445 RepID=A0ABU0TI16_9FLAO|nr:MULTISPECIES: MBL fold metallo-hydrolase [Chryseobacterium]MDT3409436.1 hydroxyacylglutathione hydrolase [Pseudacidovorax intermedius]MDQ1096699.1 hydroxyacylglutathione hydrolase [Chryseobacterium camelliae]MDQ1100643.1 hydroxyacylglutathione hydrolase [Chryseobacterium sp. SORGH_AS_1048]MDR6087981.1 hydroxyacylglutathione hydrolase [Chryseobacterium sp. SORGH_AS_0909]MDR6132356.1 hydroxyacylglutathione hydrolase [Chryseobacterium sp. SORGH_AS_1175]